MTQRLTPEEAALPEGAALVRMCRQIITDGKIDLEEIKQLRGFLCDHKDAIAVPAIPYLHELMTRITADKKVDRQELEELQIAIKAVLPKLSHSAQEEKSHANTDSLPAVSKQQSQECYDCGEIITDTPLKRGADGEYYCSPCFKHLTRRESQNKHVSGGRRLQRVGVKTKSIERAVEAKQSSATKAPARNINKEVYKCDGCDEMKGKGRYTVPTHKGELFCTACHRSNRSTVQKVFAKCIITVSTIVFLYGLFKFLEAIF